MCFITLSVLCFWKMFSVFILFSLYWSNRKHFGQLCCFLSTLYIKLDWIVIYKNCSEFWVQTTILMQLMHCCLYIKQFACNVLGSYPYINFPNAFFSSWLSPPSFPCWLYSIILVLIKLQVTYFITPDVRVAPAHLRGGECSLAVFPVLFFWAWFFMRTKGLLGETGVI